MSNTLKQHHLNALTYYAGEKYTMKMLLNSAGRHCKICEEDVQAHVFTQDIADVLKERPAISQESKDKMGHASHKYNEALAAAYELHYSFQKDASNAEARLNNYLNQYADDRVRPLIKTLINEAEQGIQITTIKDNKIVWIDHDAYNLFIKKLAHSLNNDLSKNLRTSYIYKQPMSNNLFIEFMSHPIVRGFNSLSLTAGLIALTIGVLAATGLVTGLPVTAVTALIAGGAIAGTAGIGLITCSFFRHPSPEEQAARSERISVPEMEMGTPVSLTDHTDSAANDPNQATEKEELNPDTEEQSTTPTSAL